jgi:hypothetical protein
MLKKNRDEIIWNIVNACLAGMISFLSALIAAGEINWKVIVVSLITAVLIMCIKFKSYWDGEKKEYIKIFEFVG